MTSIGLAKGTVQLQAYSPTWAELFYAEELQLRAAIGAYVLDIQHVGSTSIPGIPAKPIIDIGVAVANFEEAAVCIEPLQRVGYEYRGEFGIPRRHYFVKGEPRTHHLHMNEAQGADWEQQIAFRDYLRSHPAEAQAYAALKLRLAQQFPTDRLAYTENKSGFIFNVLRKAMPSLTPLLGTPLLVRAYKTDNQCYRWWMTTVEAIEGDRLTTFSVPGKLVHDLKGDWTTTGAFRAHYWFDRPFILVEEYEPDGRLKQVFIHISSPAVLKAGELHVVDHELDVLKPVGQPARVIDEDDFAAASEQFGYSVEFQAFCYQAAQDALTLADRWVVKGWPND